MFQIHWWALGCLGVGAMIHAINGGGCISPRDVLPFLTAFDEMTIGHVEWLTNTLARIGIIQLKHLMDDGRTVNEKWGTI